MGTYVLTGGATGIGAATKQHLQDTGHRVITVDIKDADHVADLGDSVAREDVIGRIKSDHSSLDGLITCAGVASHFPDPAKIVAINFFGSQALIAGLSDLMSSGARIVAISSNSAPMCSNEALVEAMLALDEAHAMSLAADTNGHECYAGSKQAIARWMRKVAPEYAKRGIAFNAIAPGYIETPMTAAVAQDETYGELIKEFVASIPIGRPGQPEDVANLISFLLSPEGCYIAGSLIYCDGGHDAMMRPEGLY
jgi:NAD(P)-dependent dehydrogenase (short-subunit alcohol dehydrogenase family)